MKRNYKTQLSGQIGESLVVAELGRRGIIATSFGGNVPDIDLLAYRDGISIALQVKAVRAGSISFDAKRFLVIDFEGDRQIVRDIDQTLDGNLIYVVVEIGKKAGDDRFFVLNQRQLQHIIYDGHIAWLKKHNGIRPRNPHSTHTGVSISQILEFESGWEQVERRFPIAD